MFHRTLPVDCSLRNLAAQIEKIKQRKVYLFNWSGSQIDDDKCLFKFPGSEKYVATTQLQILLGGLTHLDRCVGREGENRCWDLHPSSNYSISVPVMAGELLYQRDNVHVFNFWQDCPYKIDFPYYFSLLDRSRGQILWLKENEVVPQELDKYVHYYVWHLKRNATPKRGIRFAISEKFVNDTRSITSWHVGLERIMKEDSAEYTLHPPGRYNDEPIELLTAFNGFSLIKSANRLCCVCHKPSQSDKYFGLTNKDRAGNLICQHCFSEASQQWQQLLSEL